MAGDTLEAVSDAGSELDGVIPDGAAQVDEPEEAPDPTLRPPEGTSTPAVVVLPDSVPPPPSPMLERALVELRNVFKLRGLRPGQQEIIESVLAGRDTLAVLPTGSGKSLTYQLPSLVFEGPTIVVSPLLALIEDQVTKLQKLGIPVARIDSTRTAKERNADLQFVREGKVKLVMITPESVCSETVQNALEGIKFSLFAVDEAHCVSQWGHDFRPSYLGLRRAAQVLGRPPILALTATATPAIGEDVLVQLGMKDPKVCRVSFHRPNLAFDVRKVAGEADKLRQLGKLIQRLRRPGIVYCATVKAVDDLYVALRHGKIPVERYHGRMTGDEREKSQASFMSQGRKVVMIATNAFGLGVDKPDIRYIIHYQMPGSPESYVQEAGRAGRDGRPARCVLLFQPDDISIQEHFLKEAHPTKSQAIKTAEGLYAWSDEGKEVSVRDLAMSLALPERRVRVVLSVLEGMGVAKEIKAARWVGVEPRPTREQLVKAASVFEARRISDRRRLASLLAYMNSQECRVQMMREYFGEPPGPKCGLCDSCAGLDSEVFDPGDMDARTDLHAATDFHAKKRRRKKKDRGRGIQPPVVQVAAARVFATAIPEPLPPLPVAEPVIAGDGESTFDEGVWASLDGADAPLPGELVLEAQDGEAPWWTPEGAGVVEPEAPLEVGADVDGGLSPEAAEADFVAGWASVRDASLRPYLGWLPSPNVSLPVLPARPSGGQPQQQGRPGGGGGGGPRHPHQHGKHPANGRGGGDNQGGGRRRKRKRRDRDRDRDRGGRRPERERERGPRLPGLYLPGD